MIRKLTLAAAVPLALVAGAVTTGSAGAPDPCGGGDRLVVAGGKGWDLAAVHGDEVVLVDALGRRASLPVGLEGLVRHPALGPDGELAFVEDLYGPDVLHVAGVAKGRIAGSGEITHPAWSSNGELVWAEDPGRVRLRAPGGGVSDLGRPPGTEGVFSPVFPGDGTVAAIGIDPAPGYEGEDAALDNLWRLDLVTGEWDRLTSFAASGDDWSILRTPVAMGDGALRFVRIAGSAAADSPPAPELWAWEGGGARFLRELPAGAVLAGRIGGELVLNVPETGAGAHRLVLESGRDLGCGSAMADPVVPEDPDRAGDDVEGEAAAVADPDEPTVSDGSLAIVVGDFDTSDEADSVASVLAAAGEARILTHADAPGAVAPGVWAVAVAILEGHPVEESLDAFRIRYPQYADRSWITVP